MTCINKAKLSSELSVVETDFVRREGQARFHLFFRDLYNITVPQEKKNPCTCGGPQFCYLKNANNLLSRSVDNFLKES